MKRSNSKQQMVEATAMLLQRQGYAATGLNQIVQEAGAPKGSLYFHFPGGKEELAAAAIETSGAQMKSAIAGVIEDVTDPAEAIERVTAFLAAGLRESEFVSGCPVATVALETTSDALRDVCENSYRSWEDVVVPRLTAAGMSEGAARELTVFALSAIEGALLLSRVYRSTEPLEVTGRTLAAVARHMLGG